MSSTQKASRSGFSKSSHLRADEESAKNPATSEFILAILAIKFIAINRYFSIANIVRKMTFSNSKNTDSFVLVHVYLIHGKQRL